MRFGLGVGARRTGQCCDGAIPELSPVRLLPCSQLGVVSFPVGQLYSYGKLLGTYLGGPTAPEIAQEMVARARELAEETPRRAHSAKDEV